MARWVGSVYMGSFGTIAPGQYAGTLATFRQPHAQIMCALAGEEEVKGTQTHGAQCCVRLYAVLLCVQRKTNGELTQQIEKLKTEQETLLVQLRDVQVQLHQELYCNAQGGSG